MYRSGITVYVMDHMDGLEESTMIDTENDLVKLNEMLDRYDGSLRKALDAIDDHRYATIYRNGFKGASDADKTLWNTKTELEELKDER